MLDDAERPQDLPIRRMQRNAEIGDHVEIPDREVVAKVGMLPGICDDERGLHPHDMLAEGMRHRRLAGLGEGSRQASPTPEDLAVGADEGHERNGNAESPRRNAGCPVEPLGRGVQKPERLQGIEPRRFTHLDRGGSFCIRKRCRHPTPRD